MVGQKDEIKAYIKARSKLGCSLKQLMTELSTAYWPSCVSCDTVRRWKTMGLSIRFATPLTDLNYTAVLMLLTVQKPCVPQTYVLFVVTYNCGDTFESLLVFSSTVSISPFP
jgi:hypothetical protein